MLFNMLWNFFSGYVVIRVEGLSLEKFINLTVTNGIYLWKIKRSSYTTLTACVAISGFKKLHTILRSVRCRVKIIDKKGLPFISYRYRHRKMLIAGMLVFVVLLYGLSSFIWTVEVEGTEEVDPARIIEVLKDNGIKPGTFKADIDIMQVENRMLINLPELSWLSIQFKGSKAIVRVAESISIPEIVDRETPCNIVAVKDGIIDKLIVLDGQTVVEEGETVKEGQLLVSGIIDHPDTTGVRYVHAMGQIMARTWYEGKAEISLNKPIKKRTGETRIHKYLDIGKFTIDYQRDKITFDDYEVEETQESFFGETQFLPAKIVTRTFYEINTISSQGNSEEVKEQVEKMAWDDVQKKIPSGAKIIDKKLKYDIIEGEGIMAEIFVEALEDIGTQKIIEINWEESNIE